MMLRDRMRTIMKRRNLTRRELADAFETSPHTLRGWLDQGKTPPAAVGPLLDLIEKRPQVRAWLGLSRGKKLKRGRPFEPGNPWRIRLRRACRKRPLHSAGGGRKLKRDKWLTGPQIAASISTSSARVIAAMASSPVSASLRLPASPTLEFPGSQGPSQQWPMVSLPHQADCGLNGIENFVRSARPLSDHFPDYHGLSLIR